MGRTLTSDGLEPQTQRILACVSYGVKKSRRGVKRPGFKFWLGDILAVCPWASEVLRYVSQICMYNSTGCRFQCG